MTDTSPKPRLKATGTIHVSLVLNFRHFIDKEQKKDFDRLRGSLDYQQTLDDLAQHVSKIVKRKEVDQSGKLYPFELQEDKEKDLQDIAVDINIFSHETAKAAFTPIYWLKEDVKNRYTEFHVSSTLSNRLPNDDMVDRFVEKLKEEWVKWDKKGIQLTRDGLVHIRLEQSFESSHMLDVLEMVVGLQEDPLKDIIQEMYRKIELGEWNEVMLLALRRQFREQLDRSIQWEIAMALIELFIERSFKEQDNIYAFPQLNPDAEISNLRLYKGGTRPPRNHKDKNPQNRNAEDPIYPLHDRYVTYVFEELKEGEHVVTWSDLNPKPKMPKPLYGKEIACLLEGAMIEKEDKTKTKHFPELKEREIYQGIDLDLSSWDSELCLLSQTNAVIYYSLDPQIHFSHRPNVHYHKYWGCIMRGFEYILGLRLLALMVAKNSTKDLDLLADLLSKLDGEQGGTENENKKIQELRQRVATNTRLIGHLRDATSPLFIASADYATRKFDHFINISGLPQTIGNAEDDIRAINEFLRHHDALAAQKSENDRNRILTMWAMVLSALSIFEVFSFVMAFLTSGPEARTGIFWFIISIVSILVAIAIGLLWFRKPGNQQLLMSWINRDDDLE